MFGGDFGEMARVVAVEQTEVNQGLLQGPQADDVRPNVLATFSEILSLVILNVIE